MSYSPPVTAGLDILFGDVSEPGHAFLVDKIARGFRTPDDQVESVCGKDNSVAAVCLKDADAPKYQRAKAVGRLLIAGRSLCTGWLFGSEGHLITNNHCITNATDAFNTQFEFGAECATCDDANNTKQLACKGVTVATSADFLYTSKANDFTLVKLKLANGVSLDPYGYLQVRASGPVLGEPIYIPQHPAGKPKRFATVVDSGAVGTIENLSVNKCVADEVGYSLDTEGGSSGSPVLSANDNVVVALHNCGGCLNGGVKIQKIVAELTAKGLIPKDALVGSTTHSPTTTTTTTTDPPTTTSAPIPTTPPVATTTEPVVTDTPATTDSPSTTDVPATTTLAPPTTTTRPPTPAPTSECKGCTGCFSKLLNACLPSGYNQAQCASFTAYKTIWCGK